MRISDWSSDVCSSDLEEGVVDHHFGAGGVRARRDFGDVDHAHQRIAGGFDQHQRGCLGQRAIERGRVGLIDEAQPELALGRTRGEQRSEEHTSELQSLMRISYAVFCLKKKNKKTNTTQSCK